MIRKLKYFRLGIFLLSASLTGIASVAVSSCLKASASERSRYDFPAILDISYTPDSLHRCKGWFTDAGAWFGFTPPETDKWINGFCGPFSLDMNRREWLAKSMLVITPDDGGKEIEVKSCYFPGELNLVSRFKEGEIKQTLNFIDNHTAILTIGNSTGQPFTGKGEGWINGTTIAKEGNSIVASHPSGEITVLSFMPDVELKVEENNYSSQFPANERQFIAVSFFDNREDMENKAEKIEFILTNPDLCKEENANRWNGYLKKTLRDDMPEEYDRIAVKSITTLISNYKSARGGLLHDGIIPSHAVDYFMGLWAWDSWRFSAGAAAFDPELAKNNIRAMFDYQLPDGMIIDCIYTDPSENNARNSKPPLVCWAVDRIWEETGDREFLSEMYPQLVKYYDWWFEKRDHDHNGICEYGSTDGTLEAAAWESGMDNAIRFDNTIMLENGETGDAWSMDQESVDLNAYLANEYGYLKKFSDILGEPLTSTDPTEKIADYFFDSRRNFFFDRKISSEEFVGTPGCEAYTVLWTGIARPEQVEGMMDKLLDTNKFFTYIPFPTIASDDPKYDPRGYWRGPIWLDQSYFAISGLRNYGYQEIADSCTRLIFDRLEGLKQDAPIHENYDTHTGKTLKAPHFSWSASHLIMLYQEYGKTPLK